MTTTVEPTRQREFAQQIVARLRESGYQAYWAGGCVRDQLMGRTPKDYDVATNATPDQIRTCFGRRKTLALGAAFGVITVLGRGGEGHVEVATFREDADYADGRHPSHVTYSTADQDAQRRDFTINGLFFDPVEDEVIDFVGGQQDLNAGLIRAIGNPLERIAEDKLRMLRAVRFASVFRFEIDAATFAAIKAESKTICVVSAERIAAEMRRMLAAPTRGRAVELLASTGLLAELVPDSVDRAGIAESSPRLDRLQTDSFSTALAALIWPAAAAVDEIAARWRLAKREQTDAAWLLEHEPTVRRALGLPWHCVQPLLSDPRAAELIRLATAVEGSASADLTFCEQQLQLPVEQLNPGPLLRGDDLKSLGIPAGPDYRRLLQQTRNAQLDGIITTREAAREFALRLFQHPPAVENGDENGDEDGDDDAVDNS